MQSPRCFVVSASQRCTRHLHEHLTFLNWRFWLTCYYTKTKANRQSTAPKSAQQSCAVQRWSDCSSGSFEEGAERNFAYPERSRPRLRHPRCTFQIDRYVHPNVKQTRVMPVAPGIAVPCDRADQTKYNRTTISSNRTTVPDGTFLRAVVRSTVVSLDSCSIV